MDENEKSKGLPVAQRDMVDFAQCISECALNEINFKGNLYSWWNGRIEEECIFVRLDRNFSNNELLNHIPNSEVHHLIRQGSDHAPLHVVENVLQERVIKAFKFLNF